MYVSAISPSCVPSFSKSRIVSLRASISCRGFKIGLNNDLSGAPTGIFSHLPEGWRRLDACQHCPTRK